MSKLSLLKFQEFIDQNDYKFYLKQGKSLFIEGKYLQAIKYLLKSGELCNLFTTKRYPYYMLEITFYLAICYSRLLEDIDADVDHYQESKKYFNLTLYILDDNEYIFKDHIDQFKIHKAKILMDRSDLFTIMDDFGDAEYDLFQSIELLEEIPQVTKYLASAHYILASLYLLNYNKYLYFTIKKHFQKALIILNSLDEKSDVEIQIINQINGKLEELEESYTDEQRDSNQETETGFPESLFPNKDIRNLGKFGNYSWK